MGYLLNLKHPPAEKLSEMVILLFEVVGSRLNWLSDFILDDAGIYLCL